jgi:hypothetical protein
MVVRSCLSTNHWRASRGEGPLVLEVEEDEEDR